MIFFNFLSDQSHFNMISSDFEPIYILKLNNKDVDRSTLQSYCDKLDQLKHNTTLKKATRRICNIKR